MPIASRRDGKDERELLLPAEILPLCGDAFVRSCDLIEEYTARLALAVYRALGLDAAPEQETSAAEAIARAGLAPAVAQVPITWLLRMLAAKGWAERIPTASADAHYRVSRPLPELDPSAIAALQAAHDVRCLPSFRIAALAAECYPAVLRGETTGEEALFAPERVGAWREYFANANPLYAVANEIGAIAAARALAATPGGILELGGGLGSAAETLIATLAAHGAAGQATAYRFTDIVPGFLRHAKKTLALRFPERPVSFGMLDIDRPFAAAGVARGAYTLVYGVNVLHVARDLAATLREIHVALAPGGALVACECVRPYPDTPLYLEFVFNLLASFREPLRVAPWRPNGGFLTVEQWADALAANGFRDISAFPDIAKIRDAYPQCVVAAIMARRE